MTIPARSGDGPVRAAMQRTVAWLFGGGSGGGELAQLHAGLDAIAVVLDDDRVDPPVFLADAAARAVQHALADRSSGLAGAVVDGFTGTMRLLVLEGPLQWSAADLADFERGLAELRARARARLDSSQL